MNDGNINDWGRGRNQQKIGENVGGKEVEHRMGEQNINKINNKHKVLMIETYKIWPTDMRPKTESIHRDWEGGGGNVCAQILETLLRNILGCFWELRDWGKLIKGI